MDKLSHVRALLVSSEEAVQAVMLDYPDTASPEYHRLENLISVINEARDLADGKL